MDMRAKKLQRLAASAGVAALLLVGAGACGDDDNVNSVIEEAQSQADTAVEEAQSQVDTAVEEAQEQADTAKDEAQEQIDTAKEEAQKKAGDSSY